MFLPAHHLHPTSLEERPLIGLQMGQHPAGTFAQVRQQEDSGVTGLPEDNEQVWNAGAVVNERQCGDCGGDLWQAMG